MNETILLLEESDQVIFPTDKTNSFRCMYTKKYMAMVNEHLRCSSKEIEGDKVREIFEKQDIYWMKLDSNYRKVNLDILTNHSKRNQFQHQSY